ncbi:hypothetical protein M997_2795 [Proteus hauseri ATCC 700826]|uniref:Uncharacterized protein n=1 Tax=Proteus hauseri ATCC 700826 TaxID=1354271 RepID=A0AAJ3LTF9_PROHU|nr:hypothetical protein M997_2795 [Proteus hauseri ATCC 700826]QAV22211.1 hypothetical protein PH4a_02160 [Proteus hauseri]
MVDFIYFLFSIFNHINSYIIFFLVLVFIWYSSQTPKKSLRILFFLLALLLIFPYVISIFSIAFVILISLVLSS